MRGEEFRLFDPTYGPSFASFLISFIGSICGISYLNASTRVIELGPGISSDAPRTGLVYTPTKQAIEFSSRLRAANIVTFPMHNDSSCSDGYWELFLAEISVGDEEIANVGKLSAAL